MSISRAHSTVSSEVSPVRPRRRRLTNTHHAALRLALHHMKYQQDKFAGGSGSIILIASTSGYIGGTGVAGYVASKHGVVGLLRASQLAAQKMGVRVNAIAPFITPTSITVRFAEKWKKAGMEANTPEHVAAVIAQTSLDTSRNGHSILVRHHSHFGEFEYSLIIACRLLAVSYGRWKRPEPR